MLKYLVFVVLCALLMTSTACGAVPPRPTETAAIETPVQTASPTVPPSPTPPAVPPAHVLRVGLGQYPGTLDPQRVANRADMAVLHLAYEGLLSVDEKGNVGPGSADRWIVDKDAKSIAFHIRSGLVRSDGTAITARDFEYAIKRQIDPRVSDRQFAPLVFDVTGAADLDAMDLKKTRPEVVDKAIAGLGVKVVDDTTLVVSFAGPAAFWPWVAATWISYPTDKRNVDRDPYSWWSKPEGHTGNGPFRIQSLEPNKRIVLVPNDNYWRGKPKLDRIELVYDSNPQVLFDAYGKGDLDIDASLAPASLLMINADETIKNDLNQYPIGISAGFAFNVARKPFNDINVRKAFAAAFDRVGFVRETANGTAKPYTRWIPPGVLGSQPAKAGVPDYDPAAAVKTLVDNGYATKDSTADSPKVDCGKLGPIRLSYRSSPANNVRYQFLANNLNAAFKCPVTLDAVDANTYAAMTQDAKTGPLILYQTWLQDYAHPENWLGAYWSCTAFALRFGFCSKSFDTLIQNAEREPDWQMALAQYQQAEDELLKQVPAAFAYHGESIYLIKPYVRGPQDHTGTDDLQWPGEWGPTWTYDVDPAQSGVNSKGN